MNNNVMNFKGFLNSIHTTHVINLAAILEKCDEQILPAAFLFVGSSLNASLSDLGRLTLCRALVQATASPVSGILGDRTDRCRLVAIGCVLWGVMTSLIGISSSLWQAMISCAFNGLGLALVIPSISSLLADYTAQDRARAFGFMGFTASLGGMFGAFIATNYGGMLLLGMEGWRVVFHCVALLSLATAVLLLQHGVDPRYNNNTMNTVNSSNTDGNINKAGISRHDDDAMYTLEAATAPKYHAAQQAKQQHFKSIVEFIQITGMEMKQALLSNQSELMRGVRTVLKIKSFQVVVLQGIVGSIPWQAMVMFTLYFQLLGFSNSQAALLMAVFGAGCSAGGFIGGALGDKAAKISPAHGRVAVCQISVAFSIPLSALLLKFLPKFMSTTTDSLHTNPPLLPFAIVLLIMGLLISWCGCNNSAIFAELVPSHLRTQIYSFDRSFEGAVAACGAPLVGITAERLFGFTGTVGAAATAEARLENASALSSALLLMMIVPWALCLLSYTLLHWTYPRDKLKALKMKNERGKDEFI